MCTSTSAQHIYCNSGIILSDPGSMYEIPSFHVIGTLYFTIFALLGYRPIETLAYKHKRCYLFHFVGCGSAPPWLPIVTSICSDRLMEQGGIVATHSSGNMNLPQDDLIDNVESIGCLKNRQSDIFVNLLPKSLELS